VSDTRPLARRTLETLVYAPVGFLLSAAEEVPDMAVKGRDLLEQHLKNAHVVGHFAVALGQRRLKEQLDRLTTDRRPPAPPPSPARSDVEAQGPPTVPESPPDPVDDSPPAVDAAIPGYDALSASQVVRRLDGLGPTDLSAVFRHEATGRGRRTILHRVQQLLGVEDVP
jgi:hypothetical protein